MYYDWTGRPISLGQWARLFEDERHISEDRIGDVDISTVWMGLDHNFLANGPPLIFETMIFGGVLDGECWRYATEREAREGHARAVELVRVALNVE
jgi:hypothetical protein